MNEDGQKQTKTCGFYCHIAKEKKNINEWTRK